VAMFGYMTEIDTVDIITTYDVEVEAEDLYSLFYQFLDDFLFGFSAEPFFIARVRPFHSILSLTKHFY